MKPVPASDRDLRMPARPGASGIQTRTGTEAYGFMKFNKKEMISYV
jgi:hypothetical protein